MLNENEITIAIYIKKVLFIYDLEALQKKKKTKAASARESDSDSDYSLNGDIRDLESESDSD
jgi:hypothetical protein